jgi:predicted RNA-binding Zn-ribbon protein involved in translation (DUF1610 family)
MNRRFTDRQLHQARNNIPIRYVIETLLAIPSVTLEGMFRFRCPLCGDRHTAVKDETNLSRCFQCGRNFNAIDLCMIVRQMNFVESVKFLIEHSGQASSAENKLVAIHLEPKRAPLNGPVPVREILTGLLANGRQTAPDTPPQETSPTPPAPHDIAELARIVHNLSQILEYLKVTYQLK